MLNEAGLKAVILEGHFPGGKLANTAEVGNWPGIPEIGGAELATKMYEHCSALEIELKFDAATGLEDHGNYKTVHTNSGEINQNCHYCFRYQRAQAQYTW